MKTSQIRKSLGFVSILSLLIIQTGCLKTRAQLKEETDEPQAAQAPTKVGSSQDSQPQGGQYAIDEMKGEITRLNGRIEDLERTQKQSAASPQGPTKEESKKTEQRMVELEQAQANMLEAIKKLPVSYTHLTLPTKRIV